MRDDFYDRSRCGAIPDIASHLPAANPCAWSRRHRSVWIRNVKPRCYRNGCRCDDRILSQRISKKNEKPADTAGLRQTLPLQENLERAKGLEPSTPTLARPWSSEINYLISFKFQKS